ncbi:L-lactate permease [Companilactobacillus versmoldensis]|uniref:L-lactate permease n=1 Tax=Companilactobacillus versmoldensis DSM 14857 = KCTC 3814 TaxID=1423815 RepID=A0A0R1SDB5_9LACO|nr:L-lactate permease [Companilactobacillus versmoldensis]KRL67199.1 L-lactate transport protein [Companilactobacillus versmoldensis DSM 14857 = KCTC 3814]
MIIVALSAVILPFILLGILNMPATKGMSISAVIVLLEGYFLWKMPADVVFASVLQGIHKTLPILWILFGALMMLNTLRHTGAIDRINLGFHHLSADMRVQIIIVAYLFGGLIEGISGFGTPAMVTAPLMIALGFSPMAAVTLALVADSTPAAFGAVGTPLTVGLSNVNGSTSFLNAIGQQITRIDLFAGTFMPLMLLFLLVFFFGKKESSKAKDFFQLAPWTLVVGLVYSLTSIAMSTFVGYEFVSILTPFITIIVAIAMIKLKFLLPKSVITDPWTTSTKEISTDKPKMSLLTAWSSYIAIILMLLASRIFQPLKSFLTSAINLSWTNILGFEAIKSDWEFLYSPGTLMTIAVIIGLLIQVKSLNVFFSTAKKVVFSMKSTAIALSVTLIMVQIFANSGLNSVKMESMPVYIATVVSKSLSSVWIFIAPFLGELGAFVTGSATVSTLTFGQIQSDIATNASINQQVVLAAQLIGAAAGNMICVHNIVSVSSVVGLQGQEGNILRKTALPALVYGLLVGITGFVFISLM